VSRGLFQSSKETILNVDVNAGYNTMNNAFPEAFADGIEGAGFTQLEWFDSNKGLK
jgi:hypothetical protein